MPFLISVLYLLFCGIASHLIGEALPRRWFRSDRFPFCPWKWERNGTIYEILHIRNWKDHMPDLSRVRKYMVPKRLSRCPTSAQVRALIAETCVAETVHFALCLTAPVIWLFWRSGTGVLLSGIVIVCNLLFICVQRYNRPALRAFAKRLAEREEKMRAEQKNG